MRKKIIFMLVLAAAFAFVGCHSRTAFEGNWDCVSRTIKIGDKVMADIVKDEDNFGMKMIHDGYWMFTGQTTDNDQKSAYYGYSTYTVEDNIVTEHNVYHTTPAMMNTSFPWELTVEGDKLILKGPVKTGKFKDAPLEVTETYIRKTTSDTAGTAEVYNLFSVDGMTVPASVSHGGATLQVQAGALIINADGTCSSKMVFIPPSGVAAIQDMRATYTKDGSKLTMKWKDAGQTVGNIDGNTFTMENEGMVFVYRK